MQITINQTPIEVPDGETLIETAQRMGYSIPSLCYVKGAKHQSSCMVCAVKNCDTGQIIPSCTTFPTEGMQIDTESEELRTVRSLSLDLLLSDHRADCEAPCSMVCPHGLDIERMLKLYDTDRNLEAHEYIASVFSLPALECDHCKAPCEKICRRGSIDKAVPIRIIIRELVNLYETVSTNGKKEEKKLDKALFQSRLGRFTAQEKELLKETVVTPSGCLHCACAGRDGCKLRRYASEAGIKRTRYESSSAAPVMKKEQVTGNMWFEPAKCIRCGLCVYNSQNGFTFRDRGFGMQVIIPEENKINVDEELAKLCPTGALYSVIQ